MTEPSMPAKVKRERQAEKTPPPQTPADNRRIEYERSRAPRCPVCKVFMDSGSTLTFESGSVTYYYCKNERCPTKPSMKVARKEAKSNQMQDYQRMADAARDANLSRAERDGHSNGVPVDDAT